MCSYQVDISSTCHVHLVQLVFQSRTFSEHSPTILMLYTGLATMEANVEAKNAPPESKGNHPSFPGRLPATTSHTASAFPHTAFVRDASRFRPQSSSAQGRRPRPPSSPCPSPRTKPRESVIETRGALWGALSGDI